VSLSDRPTRRTFLGRSLSLAAAGFLAPQMLGPRAVASTASSEGGPWQIGCFTRPWDQYDYRVALDAIAEAGFKYAGLMTAKGPKGNLVISVATTPEEAHQVGLEVNRRGLEVPCVYGGDFPVQQSLEAAVKGLRTLIDNCAAVAAASLMVGGIGNGRFYRPYYKAIAEVCDYAAEKKLGIVLKPHGGLNATGLQCRKAVELVGHKNFTLWYDPGNIYYYSDGKLDPVQDAPTVAGLVTGMCVKDFTMSGEGEKQSKEVMLTPGTGRVDFPAVMAVLKKGGFRSGPLVIECLTRGDRAAILAQAKKARLFVEGLVK
jgi:sugar phosphate isomerase/epimerase